MHIPRSIIWMPSITPDASEQAVLRALRNHALYICHSVSDVQRCLSENLIDLVFANFPAPDGSPTELLARIQSMPRLAPVFIRNPGSSIDDAMCLARMGTAHLFGDDTDVEEIIHRVELLFDDLRERSRDVNEYIGESRPSSRQTPPWQRSLVGRSRPMEQVGQLINLVAARRCTILVTGETGTGKEVVARAIHAASPRAANPFVAVNCSALPENLLEAELFGHVKGAFTGAQQLRIGRFEQANRGTLFLDEVGDMPPDVQTKLLRVLQEREFERLGSSETIQVDVRIIAATNVDLRDMVRRGKFRQDLYYRLNVVPIQMPALRFRLGDIPALVQHFLERICRDEGLTLKQIDAGAVESLMERQWPGNVRQLENAVEMAVVLSGARKTLVASDFPYSLGLESIDGASMTPPLSVPDHGLDFDQTVLEFERNILTQALQRTHGNKKQAAEMLGLKRTTLSAKVRVLEAAAGGRK
jgi:DNA-binding NtrC family response regulator